MNTGELIRAVGEHLEKQGFPIVSHAQARRIVMGTFDVISKELEKKDGSVFVSGFGSFSTINKKARLGVNPFNGEKLEIPAKRAVKFKVSSKLKKIVNK